MNTIEQSAERRMKLEERLHATTARKRKLDGILTRVYTALGALNDQPRSWVGKTAALSVRGSWLAL